MPLLAAAATGIGTRAGHAGGAAEAGRFGPGTHPCPAARPVSIPVSRESPGLRAMVMAGWPATGPV